MLGDPQVAVEVTSLGVGKPLQLAERVHVKMPNHDEIDEFLCISILNYLRK